jgi:hypothetical protein
MAADELSDGWQSFIDLLSSVERAVGRVSAVNVNAATARAAAKSLTQEYFRRTRPDLQELGISAEELDVTDARMQYLLQLANGRNPKRTYMRVLRDLRREAQKLELAREYRLGEQRRGDEPAAAGATLLVGEVEAKILATLESLIPAAALSYKQALRDLAATDRVSYRGTANELRETLRETVDRLAPDEEVMAATGFKLERDQTKPTQKQKVRHVLRSRKLSKTARKTPEDSVSLVEELTGSLARSSYERSSLSAHVASSQREVRQLKMYVDSVLAELLQVHG